VEKIMIDFLRDPVWQGIGVVITLLLGLLSFYFSGKNRFWLYLSAGIIILFIGIWAGSELLQSDNSESPAHILTLSNNDGTIFSGDLSIKSYKGDAFGKVIYNFQLDHYSDGASTYALGYALPEEGDGYSAGLSFVFVKAVDLTQYKFLEISILLNKTTCCNLILKDTYNKVSTIRIGELSLDTSIGITAQGAYQIIKIPNKNHFQEINPTSVSEIAIEANSSIFRGSGTFTVVDIRLIK
jgi:hypothetical protein